PGGRRHRAGSRSCGGGLIPPSGPQSDALAGVAEVFDPATRYEYELPLPSDIARALELDAKFEALGLGLPWPPSPSAGKSTGFGPAIDATLRNPRRSTLRACP